MCHKHGLGTTHLGSCGRIASAALFPMPAPARDVSQRIRCFTTGLWLVRQDSETCENTTNDKTVSPGSDTVMFLRSRDLYCTLRVRRVSPGILVPVNHRPASETQRIEEKAQQTAEEKLASRFSARPPWRHRRLASLPSLTLFIILMAAILRPVLACPAACTCTTPSTLSRISGQVGREGRKARAGVRMACVGAGLSMVPRLEQLDGLDPATVTSLDLSNNNLTSLPDLIFSDFPGLQYLKLSGNRISSVSPKAFHRLPLQNLYLDNNHLSGLLTGSLPTRMLELSLEDNFFSSVPPSVTPLTNLQFLNLARNKISGLRVGELQGLRSLTSLSLHQNKITTIEEAALESLPQLQVLDLTENHLVEVPAAILRCSQLTRLLLGNNQVTYLGEGVFTGLAKLEQVVIQGNPLLTVHQDAFTHLPSLTKLILKETRELTDFPSLNGTYNLEMLRIDRAALTSVPDHLCSFTPKLRSLNLHLNSISDIPVLEGCHHLKLLDLSDNALSSLGHGRLTGAPHLQDLLLQHNRITHVPADAFFGLPHLQVLALQQNQISQIEEDAFLPLISLEDINLGDNVFPKLPQRGLEHVLSIKVHNNPYLREFPGPESFPKVHTLTLSYAYHCCPFLSLEVDTAEDQEVYRIQEDVLFNVSDFQDIHPGLWNISRPWPHDAGTTTTTTTTDLPSTSTNIASTTAGSSSSPSPPSSSSSPPPPPRQHHLALPVTPSIRIRPQCIPLPGPFMPCRDLFDWWTLRCGVWIVFLLALMGNGVVVVVLVAAYAKMDVPRFLVTNLALADFFMGVYLGFLAVADASTLGEFRMYAIPWQMSPACQVAGFLGVLSSELSVYTLAVITLERNYAITHAMHLQKRLSLRQAAYIMAVGWVFAITMAVLPLAGVSDYRKFAVCLPFETDGAGLGYVVFLMFINGVAFLILMGCYFKIYCAIRGSQAWNSNDSRIAKRMALLVFTDFICWAPIAFFSLTAAFDIHLISLEEAKVFTVFVLPLNSCCNPFLYALLTKQFKKDCVMLCKTIEESRVTRGIGRCRHSSNFSNRQTPANTNSAVDHTSQGDKQSCSCKGKQEKNKRPRWTFISLKYLLCTKGAEEITSSSDTSYQTDPAQHRGPRHTSLSSDTYSGSWSDTWRRGRGSTTLRMMDRRRHNSWAASNKPSQESSLSSSRPDSSATSASTATWRISRSSVSSDTSNSSGRVKTSEPGGPSRLGSLRRGDGRGFGPTRQLSQSQFVKETPCTRPPPVRPKPRLQRQGAVEREAYTPGKENSGLESPPCPLHLRPDHLSCVYEQSHEDDNMAAGTSPGAGLPTQPTLLLSPCSLDTPMDDDVFTDPPDEEIQVPVGSSPSHRQEITLVMPTEEANEPAATENTALMAEGDTDAEKETSKEPQSNKVLETHFPLEATLPEVRPLI
ncbi:leucine-rich repeat-containing G-protein coupled receptor 4-like isoform X2 [Homarus americanus]|uniref:leucine-rich repeat-containing G-protein coupled receptor 4-like isoform X2 n=1 Tax=Homarus americanus TaxID=6706 RepID=UPI001C460420|nr:leucine-rich repeat-containing G-protein coupled receptor 4-like isoform X2 [Homarus americanus]